MPTIGASRSKRLLGELTIRNMPSIISIGIVRRYVLMLGPTQRDFFGISRDAGVAIRANQWRQVLELVPTNGTRIGIFLSPFLRGGVALLTRCFFRRARRYSVGVGA